MNQLHEKNKICRGCLRNDESVQIASEKMSVAYCNFVSQPHITDPIFFCVHCKFLMIKSIKFLRQCHLVNRVLESIHIEKETNLRRCYDLKIKNLDPVDIYPQDSLEFEDFKTEEPWDDDRLCDLPDNDEDDDKPLIVLRDSAEDIKIEDGILTAISNEKPNNESNGKELIGDNVKKKRKKKKKMKIEVQVKGEDSKTEMKIMRKNKLKNGFSSRMVQETEEYVVIKLTREQVIDEMRTRRTDLKYTRAPYKCEMCVKGYNFEDVLNNHMKKHTQENGTLKCDICSQYCPSAVSMRGHLKSHTTRYQCKVCREIRLSRQHLLEHHALAHTGRVLTYNCTECSFTTNKRTVIQRHWRRHAGNGARACPQCGRLCTSVESLRAHLLRHESNKKYACNKCEKSFIYPSLLEAHEKLHGVPTEDWYCVECDVHFKTQDNLKTHFRKSVAHRDPSLLKYACEWCDKRCPSESALAAHRAAMHGAAKTHVCSLCDKAYSSADGLRAHTRRAHRACAPTTKHVCDVCNKTFTSKASCMRHSRVHTGERPYVCVACGARFAQSSTLRTHARLRHDARPGLANQPADRENRLAVAPRKMAVI